MSTRSYIAHKEADTYEGVYCHWDGYPEHNGLILLEHYSDAAKLRELISLGDISSLGPEIGEPHDFLNQPEGWTTFYGRDRGEKNIAARSYATLDELTKSVTESGCEFVYVYDGFWQYCERGAQYFGLSDGSGFSPYRPLWTAFDLASQA